jgi:class 3 adenylate cyclase
MRCPRCQAENLAGSLFCTECGANIEVTCAGCGGTNPTGAKFCRRCGAFVDALVSPRAPGEPAPASMGAVSPSSAARSVRQTRLALVDWLLLGTLLPLAVFGVIMTVVHGVRGDFVVAPFLVSAAADQESYPVIAQLWSSPNAKGGQLAVGDRLLRLEDIDLRGVSNAAFLLHWSPLAQRQAALALTVERGGMRFDVRVPRVPGYLMPSIPWWATLPFVVVSVGTAVLLLVRGAHWHLARHYYVVSLLVALCSTPYFSMSTAPRLDQIRLILVFPLALGLSLWAINEALPGLRLWGQGQRAVAIGLALVQLASFAAVYWLPGAGTAMGLGAIAATGFVIADLMALTRVYGRADALERRQLKWAVYGLYVGLSALGFVTAVLSLGVVREWVGALFAVGMIALVAIPLGILVAIAFYDFLDIDRLFSATLSYSGLMIVAVVTVLVLLPQVAETASSAVGIAPVSGQIALAILVALAILPAQRRVRAGIEWLLFRQRHAVDQGIQQLLTDLTGGRGLEEMAVQTGERLDALFAPESCTLYARAGEAYVPVFQRGRVAPATFDQGSPLIAALRVREAPLVGQARSGRRWVRDLAPFDRAALETLGAVVVVPIRRRGELIAFACLGRKTSGDVYTSTDATLLAAVGSKLSGELLRLDDRDILRDARALQERLRRYVPEPVASQLAGGKDLVSAEREVSVLFVDIRGHSTYAETRDTHEIVSTVNRFTELVSSIVRQHGGAVVEFSGDGLMALFGASDDLAHKERAAVEAGREMVTAVASLMPSGSDRPLSVGVGIATGRAFVGNVRAADHLIWTAIGNTPNLAARLQALTREFDASMIVDAPTRRETRSVTADFIEHQQTPIRGLSHPFDLYVLPLGKPPNSQDR